MEQFSCEQLKKSYDGQLILDDISLTVGHGELVSILGASGVGKTTLFQLISGLEPLDSGRVLLDGRDITGQTGIVGYMLQKDLLLPFRTVLDNVCLPLQIQGKSLAEAREQAFPLLLDFGLDDSAEKYPSQISGGMRQRAALLRTYLCSGSMMLLDEPFSALDAITKASLHDWYFDMIHSKGVSTLFITHDIDEAILLSDRIYVLSGSPGKLTQEFRVQTKLRKREFALTVDFLQYKQQILAAIENVGNSNWKGNL